MEKILKTKKLTKVFPGVIALDNLDFDLEAGEIHAIVGENGAGKSTFIKMLAGVYRPTEGEMVINGENKSFNYPREAIDYVGVVHQENELVPHFTGYENLFLGNERVHSGFLNKSEMIKEAESLLEKYKFNLDLKLPASEMSSGQQEMLSILRILYLKSPILIFDEPTAQLGMKESEILFELIKKLKKDGYAIIYISHHLEEVLEIADRISVLRNGKKVVTLENKEVTEKQLIKHMVSKDITDLFPKTKVEIGETVVKIKEYTNKRLGFDNISFDINAGEIVGFAGLVGSGRSELAKSIFYEYKKNKNNITIKSKNGGRKTKISLIPENRREEGIILDFTVGENIVLPHLAGLCKSGYLQKKRIKDYIKSVLKKFAVKCASSTQEIRTLSGGNQQKVSIGKWMGEECDLWIFDEPTQGVDVDAKTEIFNIMGDIIKEGAAIWMISSELQELTAIADRIYVMNKFDIVSEFSPPYNKEKILNKMIGVN